MTRAIVVGGLEIACDVDVHGVSEHGLTFPSARLRTWQPDLIVVHDTAGEGSGPAVHRTLAANGLSIHFVVDREGTIWQYVDAMRFACAHVGKGANSRSIGIEVANAVFPPGVAPGLFASLKRYALTGKERLHGRPIIVDEYRGAKRRVLGHLPAQRIAVRALVRALLGALPTIPARLPRSPGGKIHGDRLPFGWQGICGHLHLTDAHVDPALDVFDELTALA